MSKLKRQLVIFMVLGTSFLLGTIISDFVARSTKESNRVGANEAPVHSMVSSNMEPVSSAIAGP